MRNLCPPGYRSWKVHFDGGAIVALCAGDKTSRDQVMQMARDTLAESADWDARQMSKGRIVKCYEG